MRNTKRKNFLGTLILILLFWTLQVFMIFFVEPETIKNLILPNSYFLFFLNLFLALFFTIAIILADSKHSLIITSGIIFYLVLQSQGLGNPLNLILILAAIIALEVYFNQTNN